MTKEGEIKIKKIARRFIVRHNRTMWAKLNYYLFKCGASQRRTAGILKINRCLVRYWKEKIKPPPKRRV